MKTTKKDECSYSFSNAIRTLAMVRTIGLGEDNDLHPHNKKDVGELLADLAEKMTGNPPTHPPEK